MNTTIDKKENRTRGIKTSKNIPIPSFGQSAKWMSVVMKMGDGDSVFVRKQTPGIFSAIRKSGFKPIGRRVSGGFRIWKVGK